MADDWITTDEGCQLTGYSAEYLRRLIRNEVVRARKWSRSWQISRSSLLAYFNESKKSNDKRRGPR